MPCQHPAMPDPPGGTSTSTPVGGQRLRRWGIDRCALPLRLRRLAALVAGLLAGWLLAGRFFAGWVLVVGLADASGTRLPRRLSLPAAVFWLFGFQRGGKTFSKGVGLRAPVEAKGVYADQISETAWRAHAFRSYDEDEW